MQDLAKSAPAKPTSARRKTEPTSTPDDPKPDSIKPSPIIVPKVDAKPESGSVPTPRVRIRDAQPETPHQTRTDDAYRPPSPSMIPDQPPAVLVVGTGYPMLDGTVEALTRHGLHVETSSCDKALDSVVVAAPDVVLLVGDAADDNMNDVLDQLAGSPLSSVIPVIILTGDQALGRRVEAYRHGAAGVIDTNASVDAVARELAELATNVPERSGSVGGTVATTTLEELAKTLTNELKSGILSVRGDEEDSALGLVISDGPDFAKTIDDFVARVQKHIVGTSNVSYEFQELAGGTLSLIGAEGIARAEALGDVRGLRIVIADTDSARADAVAQALRDAGGEVLVTDYNLSEARLARLHPFDPSVVVCGERELDGPALKLLDHMRSDLRLRWAALLVARWSEVWPESLNSPVVDPLLGSISALAEAERSVTQRAAFKIPFDLRLESIGPARLLRALESIDGSVRVTVHNPRLQAQIDLSDGLIVGATARKTGNDDALEGSAALATLLVLRSGRVNVRPVDAPAVANVMATVEGALHVAEQDEPSLPVSLFPGALQAPVLGTGAAKAADEAAPDDAAEPAPQPSADASVAPPKPPMPGDEPSDPAPAPPAPRSAMATAAAVPRALEAPAAGAAPTAPQLEASAFAAARAPTLDAPPPEPPTLLQPDFAEPADVLAGVPPRKSRRGLYAGLGVLAVAGAIGAGVWVTRSRTSPGAQPAASSAAGAPQPSSATATTTGADPTPPTPAKLPLLDRVKAGDEDAIAVLANRPGGQLTTEEALALAAGRSLLKRTKADKVLKSAQSDKLADPEVYAAVLELARDPATYQKTQAALAKMKTSVAVRALYETWVGTRGTTDATKLARALVYTADVRKHASKPLAVALDLRELKGCPEALDVVKRATEHGDRRSLRLLGKLGRRRGCGPTKRQDCFACLRRPDILSGAIRTVKRRPVPKLK